MHAINKNNNNILNIKLIIAVRNLEYAILKKSHEKCIKILILVFNKLINLEQNKCEFYSKHGCIVTKYLDGIKTDQSYNKLTCQYSIITNIYNLKNKCLNNTKI